MQIGEENRDVRFYRAGFDKERHVDGPDYFNLSHSIELREIRHYERLVRKFFRKKSLLRSCVVGQTCSSVFMTAAAGRSEHFQGAAEIFLKGLLSADRSRPTTKGGEPLRFEAKSYPDDASRSFFSPVKTLSLRLPRVREKAEATKVLSNISPPTETEQCLKKKSSVKRPAIDESTVHAIKDLLQLYLGLANEELLDCRDSIDPIIIEFPFRSTPRTLEKNYFALLDRFNCPRPSDFHLIRGLKTVRRPQTRRNTLGQPDFL